MYTTFIIDEVGNRKIIMDWRGKPRFKWNEVKVSDLLSQYPNHCAGLTFGYFWTGDDWQPQQNRIVSPKYGCLPNFKGPDLPSPRTPLEDIGPQTRKSDDRSAPSYLPVEVEDKPSDLNRGRPRIRCAICAWNLELQAPFDRMLPAPEKRPDKPPAPNQFATMIRRLIEEGRVTRRQLGEALIGNNRWRNLDRWLDTDQEGKKKFYAPRPEQFARLLSVLGDVDATLYLGAIEADKVNFHRNQEWAAWREIHQYPEWATIEKVDDEVWYHHHYCGRNTADSAEVVDYQVQLVDINGQMISVLQEEWQDQGVRWISITIPKGGVNQNSLESHFSNVGDWSETEHFYFGVRDS